MLSNSLGGAFYRPPFAARGLCLPCILMHLPLVRIVCPVPHAPALVWLLPVTLACQMLLALLVPTAILGFSLLDGGGVMQHVQIL